MVYNLNHMPSKKTPPKKKNQKAAALQFLIFVLILIAVYGISSLGQQKFKSFLYESNPGLIAVDAQLKQDYPKTNFAPHISTKTEYKDDGQTETVKTVTFIFQNKGKQAIPAPAEVGPKICHILKEQNELNEFDAVGVGSLTQTGWPLFNFSSKVFESHSCDDWFNLGREQVSGNYFNQTYKFALQIPEGFQVYDQGEYAAPVVVIKPGSGDNPKENPDFQLLIYIEPGTNQDKTVLRPWREEEPEKLENISINGIPAYRDTTIMKGRETRQVWLQNKADTYLLVLGTPSPENEVIFDQLVSTLQFVN
jgi:hypothetical protein